MTMKMKYQGYVKTQKKLKHKIGYMDKSHDYIVRIIKPKGMLHMVKVQIHRPII